MEEYTGEVLPLQEYSGPVIDGQPEITPEMKAQAYRDAAEGMPWFQRNAAALATPFVGGYQSVMELFGAGDPELVAKNKILQEEAPVGAIAGAIAPAAFAPVAAPTALGRIGLAAASGGVGGLLTPTGKERATLADKAEQVGIGATLAAAFGTGLEGVRLLYVAGKNLISPMLSKAAAERAAAKLARYVIGGKADDIAEMIARGEIDETAVQAAIKSGRPEFAALGKIVERSRMPGEFDKVRAAQEAARSARIKSVTPDLANAEKVREEVAGSIYQKAYQSDVMRREMEKIAGATGVTVRLGALGEPIAVAERLPASIKSLAGNPVIQAAEREARILAQSLPGIPKEVADNPMATLEGLHLMKVAIDNQFKNRAADTALKKYSDSALEAVKKRLLGAIDDVSPLYTQARNKFAELSIPVNQAKVLGEMQSVMTGPSGKESVNKFLNVLGRGEQALLKKSTGFPRYESGDLAKVLSEQQMSAVNKVKDEMLRDIDVDRLAALGMEKTRKMVGAAEDVVPHAGWFSRATTIMNSVIKRMEGKGGEKIETTLAELMLPQNKAKFAQLIKNATSNERAALIAARAQFISGAAASQLQNME